MYAYCKYLWSIGKSNDAYDRLQALSQELRSGSNLFNGGPNGIENAGHRNGIFQSDIHSGKRYINLLTGDHILRWQIVTPHDDASLAAHSPFTWNTHVYFARANHPSYVQSYQLN